MYYLFGGFRVKPMSKGRVVIFACLAVTLGFAAAIGLAELSLRIHLYFTEADVESIAPRDHGLGFNPFDVLHGLNGCTWPDTLYPHPRYGFIQQKVPSCGWPISNLSVYGHDLPEEKDPSRFVILVLGGSVAQQVTSGHTLANRNWIEENLNRYYTGPKGEEFLVVNGALGAWKQPNQLFRLIENSERIDGFISIEGYNESAIISLGARFEKPSPVYAGMVNLPDLPLGFSFMAKIAKRVLVSTGWAERSLLAKYIYVRIVDIFNSAYAKNIKNTHFEGLHRYPETWSFARQQEASLEKYIDYLHAMNAFAAEKKIKGALFIQPIPNLYKTLAEGEWPAPRWEIDANIYLNLEREILSENFRALNPLSLLKIYEKEPDLIYFDDIHARYDETGYNKGYDLMGRAVAGHLSSVWQLPRKRQ